MKGRSSISSSLLFCPRWGAWFFYVAGSCNSPCARNNGVSVISMHPLLYGTLIGAGLLLAPVCAPAQSTLEKRVIITGENPPARNRLDALDRQIALLVSADDVGKWIGWSAPAFPLRAVAAAMLHGGAVDKWEQ